MKLVLTATKVFRFSYAHALVGYKGNCSSIHGHNARLEVTIKGRGGLPEEDSNTKAPYLYMVMDFAELKEVVERVILSRYDHVLLNNMLGVPTAEEMVRDIWLRLEKVFSRDLIRLRLYETDDSFVELEREGD